MHKIIGLDKKFFIINISSVTNITKQLFFNINLISAKLIFALKKIKKKFIFCFEVK
jgi:hypothetical protein